MDSQNILLIGSIILMIVAGLYFLQPFLNKKEKMTGFGVVTGLAFNNRNAYCLPPSDDGAFSGGCFVPHRVIF